MQELIKLKKAKVAAKGAEAVEEGEADDEFERETILLTVQTAARRALRELDMTYVVEDCFTVCVCYFVSVCLHAHSA